MPLLPFFLVMAQGAATTQLDVPVLHRRPSKIARILTTMGDSHVLLVANDETSTLRLIGTKSDVEAMRGNVGLFDVAPRKARFSLRVVSPLDHADWKGEIEARNNEAWTGADGGTNVQLKLTPRMNVDGTCAVMIEVKSPDAAVLKTIFRLKPGEEIVLTTPSELLRPGQKPEVFPQVAVRYLAD